MNKKEFDLSLKIGAKKLHQARKKFYEVSNRHHIKFLDGKGVIKKKYLIKRVCPLCKKENKVFLFYKNGGKYNLCNKCEMIYLNPCFKDKELENYYKNMHDMQSKTLDNEKKFYEKIYNHGLKIIEKKVIEKKNKNLLDIGCSNGLFLDLAKMRGYETYGVELNSKEFNIVKKKHVAWNINYINLYNYVKFKFDVITMWDVIEHIKNIDQLANTIKKLLKPKGLFFFQTPNSFSLATRILKDKCNLFDGIEHVNLFNFNNINYLAKKFGFKLLIAESVISEIPVINNYINFRNIYLGEKKKDELSIINENEIHDKKLGYKMQVLFEVLK